MPETFSHPGYIDTAIPSVCLHNGRPAIDRDPFGPVMFITEAEKRRIRVIYRDHYRWLRRMCRWDRDHARREIRDMARIGGHLLIEQAR